MHRQQVISEKVVFSGGASGRGMEVKEAVVKLENGNKVKWSYADLNDVVAVIAIDREKNIYLVREWRLPWRKNILQIPAGVVRKNAKNGEMLAKAKKELEEEIGFRASSWKLLTTYLLSSSSTRCRQRIYLATGLKKVKANPEKNELLEIVKMPLEKAIKKLLASPDTTSFTKIGLLLVK